MSALRLRFPFRARDWTPSFLWWLACAGTLCAESPNIFSGPPAAYISAPTPAARSTEVIRWVTVQERMQIARPNAPVRVPVFFAAGECRDPAEISLVRWPSRQPVSVQVDDVRRGSDGGVARLHLWFDVSIDPGETQRWALIKRERMTAVETSPAVAAKITGQKLEVASTGTEAAFFLDLTKHGPLASLHLDEGPVLDFPGGAGAMVSIRDTNGTDETITTRESGSLEWGSGPVFAKIVVRCRGAKTACRLEQVFRIFSDGSINITQSVFPSVAEEPLKLKTQEFLSGRLIGTDAPVVRPQPAGIVDLLADFHRGYVVDGLTQAGRPRGWLVVPGSLGGTAGRVALEKGNELSVHAPGSLASGEGDSRPRAVRGFWSEVTLYPAQRKGEVLARAALLAASQPLVAVVDRPDLDCAAAVARVEDNVREMKPVGWVNETVVRELSGRPASFPKRNWKAEETPAHWVAAAERAHRKVVGNSDRRLAEDEKGKAAGPLDPYHITYGSTGIAYWLMRDELPSAPLAALRAQLDALRQRLARTDEQGWPYLDVFARTQNMQMGPPFLALTDRMADAGLRRFYRDQLTAPQLAAVMLHGMRPYEGRPQKGAVPSDELYQGVVDFFLRATELALNESLGFHPVAFGRFLDAIDVNADLYHPFHARAAELADGFAHANFFRMQSHLHRWLNWGPAPFVALLQSPVADGFVPGATETWYFADALAGHWKNWPDQSWLFLAAKLPARTAGFAPPARPPAVQEVRIQRDGEGNHLAWERIQDAAAYRIYRLRAGEPPVWLNSPYVGRDKNNPPVTEWNDPNGKSGDNYRIHVVDAVGRESGW